MSEGRSGSQSGKEGGQGGGSKEDWDAGRGGGVKISFGPVTTDHKNTKGRKEEMKRREEGRISATSGMTEHGWVRERGVGWEMGGILGVWLGLVLLQRLGIGWGRESWVIWLASWKQNLLSINCWQSETQSNLSHFLLSQPLGCVYLLNVTCSTVYN